jgi:hypothetical protein
MFFHTQPPPPQSFIHFVLLFNIAHSICTIHTHAVHPPFPCNIKQLTHTMHSFTQHTYHRLSYLSFDIAVCIHLFLVCLFGFSFKSLVKELTVTPVNQYVCFSGRHILTVCMPICHSCQAFHSPSACLGDYLVICLPICLSIYLSICLWVYLFVLTLSLSLCQSSVYTSVCSLYS